LLVVDITRISPAGLDNTSYTSQSSSAASKTASTWFDEGKTALAEVRFFEKVLRCDGKDILTIKCVKQNIKGTLVGKNGKGTLTVGEMV
jgi:hypothetical protein